MEYMSVDDFDKICRTCFAETELKNVSMLRNTQNEHGYARNPSISELLLLYLDIRFDENDRLPKNICQKCTTRIDEFHKFTRDCNEKQIVLDKILSQIQLIEKKCNDIKIETEELSNKEDEEKVASLIVIQPLEHKILGNVNESIKLEIKEYDSCQENDCKPSAENLNTNLMEDKHENATEEQKYFLNEKVLEESFSCKFNPDSGKDKIPYDKEVYRCSSCNESFSQKSSLIKHFRIHTGEKVYTCLYCNSSFPTKRLMVVHTRIHTSEKPYMCSYCNRSFSNTSNLFRHIRLHKGVKPHTCPHCNESFSQKSSLIKHFRMHPGEKPYTCSYCNESFSTKSLMVDHARIHKSEKPTYVCSYCNKSFSNTSNLFRHIRIHKGIKPHTCSYCDKSFHTKSHMVDHARIHTGEKPYTCLECNKSFSIKSNLTKHLGIHTGEKP